MSDDGRSGSDQISKPFTLFVFLGSDHIAKAGAGGDSALGLGIGRNRSSDVTDVLAAWLRGNRLVYPALDQARGHHVEVLAAICEVNVGAGDNHEGVGIFGVVRRSIELVHRTAWLEQVAACGLLLLWIFGVVQATGQGVEL